MKGYLEDYYGKGQKVAGIDKRSGIVCFKDCGFSDATGHFDVIVNGQVAGSDYSESAK